MLEQPEQAKVESIQTTTTTFKESWKAAITSFEEFKAIMLILVPKLRPSLQEMFGLSSREEKYNLFSLSLY